MNIYRIVILVFFIGSALLQAQDESQTKNKTSIINSIDLIIGANAIDYFPVKANESDRYGAQGDLFQDFFNYQDNWNTVSNSGFLSLSTKISFFNIGFRTSFNQITKVNINNVLQPTVFYTSNDLYLKFPVSYIFRNQKFFQRVDPYLELGGGYTLYNSEGSSLAMAGAGFDFWIIPYLGVSVQSNYKYNFETVGAKHFQHLVGIHLKTDFLKDTDKDRVPDKKDACPKVPGLKKYNGCPDTDRDGIIDKSDSCPNLQGLAEHNGCPDTDKDGVYDNIDLCVEVPGLPENKGCPSDENVDKVEDSIESETRTNNISLSEYTVLFAPESYKILGQRNLDIIEEVKNIVVNNSLNILVEGHASDDGSAQYNQKISAARANTVKAKLIALGVPESSISIKGLGEDYPVDNANNPISRAKSRRVTFKVIIKEEKPINSENK